MSQALRVVVAAFAPLCVVAGPCLAADAVATRPTTAAATATQPADDVIVRLGDADRITESEFEEMTAAIPPAGCTKILTDLVVDRLFLLYIKDHPELVPEEKVERGIEHLAQSSGGREKLAEKLAQAGGTWEDIRRRFRRELARAALIQGAQRQAQQEGFLKKMFDEDPTAFNGTNVKARHILFAVYPYDTPLVRENTRQRLAKLRNELLEGRTTWDDAVLFSDCNTKGSGGLLGSFSRHMMISEPVAKAAFGLQVGEISEIIESDLGFHIVQVLGRYNGQRSFDDPATQREMNMWMEQAAITNAVSESRRRHPVLGIRMPQKLLRESGASQPAH